MRVAKADGTEKPILQELQLIATFLNAVGADMTRSQWHDYLKAFRKENGARGPLIAFKGNGRIVAACTLRHAKEVRQHISSDLRYLQFDREHIRTTEHPFGPLMLRLTEQFTAGSWQCTALGTANAEPGQAILRLRRQGKTEERWAATFTPFRVTRTLKDSFYAILGRALLSGTLTRLKLCLHCGRYFVAIKDRKRQVCPEGTCKDDYQNKKKKDRNYWKNLRADERARQIDRAEALKAKGMSIEEVWETVNLPRRVLAKVFET